MTQRKKRRTGVFRSILILLAFAIVVAAILVLTIYRDEFSKDSVSRFFSGDDSQSASLTPGKFEFPGSRENKYAAFGDGLLVLAPEQLFAYDELGREIYNVQTTMQHPELVTAGDYALSFDRGGNAFVLSDTSKELFKKRTDGAIISASVNKAGWFCAAARKTGYKAVVMVFDDNQTERFAWYSADRYVADAVLSPVSDRLAVASIGQSEGRFMTRISVMNVADEKDIKHYDIMNTLALKICYLSENSICVVTEDRILFLDGVGEFVSEQSFGGKHLTGMTFGEGFAALIHNRYASGGRSELISVSLDGAELGRLPLGENVSAVSAEGGFIAVLTGDILEVFSKTLEKQYSFSGLTDVRQVKARRDGSAIVIGSDQARVISKD